MRTATMTTMVILATRHKSGVRALQVCEKGTTMENSLRSEEDGLEIAAGRPPAAQDSQKFFFTSAGRREE